MTDEQFVAWLRTMPDVGTALYRLREMQQLTQQEVAELTGVSRPYIAHVERGDRMPERDTVIAILLAALSLPIRQANRVLLLAKYAPLHHVQLAKAPIRGHGAIAIGALLRLDGGVGVGVDSRGR
jgi:transcriptional regulator with XRE-family HTH domain